MTFTPSRRSLLLGASGVTAGVIGLTGCQTSDQSPKAAPVDNAVLPAFEDSITVEPDLVSAEPGGLSGFFEYPADPQPSTTAPPLSGEKLRALTFTYDPAAPPMDRNSMWQAINEAIGGTLEIGYVHNSEYQQKLSTVIAGGDIPDLVSINRALPGLPDMLEAAFADLTEHLSGDAILDYPNLAGLATESWQDCVVAGKIRGVPVPRLPIPGVPFMRKDLVAKTDLPAEPRDVGEFRTLMRGLVDKKNSVWACGDPGATMGWILASLGGTTGWSEEGGKFTHGVETEQFQQALADARELADAGVFHPDSLAANNNQRNDWFTNGTTPIVFGGYAGWAKYRMWGAAVPGFELGTLNLFAYDSSSQPKHPRGNVKASMTSVAAGDSDQIKQRLNLLNWLAAPFGSTEHRLLGYGVEGQTYDLQGNDPVHNDRGTTERTVPWGYLASGPQSLYNPGQNDITQNIFDYQETALPVLATDPTLGLFSATNSSRGSEVQRALNDAKDGILAGRQAVSTWPDAVARWRSDGGDTIREEYQTAFADSQ